MEEEEEGGREGGEAKGRGREREGEAGKVGMVEVICWRKGAGGEASWNVRHRGCGTYDLDGDHLIVRMSERETESRMCS